MILNQHIVMILELEEHNGEYNTQIYHDTREKEPIHGRAMVISDIIRPVVVVSVVRVVICVAPIGGLIMLQRPVAQAGR